MNPDKLAKLQEAVRTGGPGTQRRKKKIVRRDPGADDQKVKTTLKKLGCAPVGAIDEVNMIKDDGSILHFTGPKVQAAVAANTFSVAGSPQCKRKILVPLGFP
ncbi:hypothetical protein QR680_006645 [Steinernema hermaphroditum]|uniref:Transcription factor BTF3 n=1 Tax=Steinernema hermaphroditum TaxID=289476 RepID=A0AA39LXR4_9BILA|nr:hypothetical protein QR680_006645 [Steinernema hermaphroditum]